MSTQSILSNRHLVDSMNVYEQIRKEYQSAGIDRSQLDRDPLGQFDQWFQTAVEKSPGRWMEANAMALATSDGAGQVSVRTVLLKHHGPGGFVFFTNYQSEKGLQIQANAHVALLFHWPYLGRQIRIEGTADRVDRAMSEQYFHSRPRGAQFGASISDQSRPVASRQELIDLRNQREEELDGQPVPLPDSWGGYRVQPRRFEFWQGREDRLHDRFSYSPGTEGRWTLQRLAP